MNTPIKMIVMSKSLFAAVVSGVGASIAHTGRNAHLTINRAPALFCDYTLLLDLLLAREPSLITCRVVHSPDDFLACSPLHFLFVFAWFCVIRAV